MQKSSLMYSKQTYSGQQPSGKRRASGTIAILIGLMLVILILGGLCSFSWFLRLNHKDQPAPGLLSGLRPEAIFMGPGGVPTGALFLPVYALVR